MKKGKWVLHNPSTGAALEIQIVECVVWLPAVQPVVMSLDSWILQTPFKINFESERLTAFVNHSDCTPHYLKIKGSGGLSAVLPKLNSESKSVINSMAFRFNLKDRRLEMEL